MTENDAVPVQPAQDIVSLLKCGNALHLQRTCGHEEVLPCESIFKALQLPCKRVESELCKNCNNNVTFQCFEKGQVTARICENEMDKICSVCRINLTKGKCYWETTERRAKVCTRLPCGHNVVWICGEDDDPRLNLEMDPCIECMLVIWSDALDVSRACHRYQNDQVSASGEGVVNDTNTDRIKRAAAAERRMDSTSGNVEKGVFDVLDYIKSINGHAQSKFPLSLKADISNLENTNPESMLKAHVDMLSKNVDLLRQAVTNGSWEIISVRSPLRINDYDCAYDIVVLDST